MRNPEPAFAAPVSEPLYFPADAARLFGWLHRPARPHGDLAVLICKPFGYEAVCGHRSLRAFAEMAAQAGVPALRFDYSGSGDAANIDPDADQVELWGDDVLAAVAELRRRTGVTRVCVFGFRLGALLATVAATRSDSIAGLVLIAPVLSGARYLRELRLTRHAANIAAVGQEVLSDGSGDSAAPGAGAAEVSGHSISAATLATLSRLAAPAPGPPGRGLQLLVIDRDDLPAASGWCESLRAAGMSLEYVALPGFIEMMMTAPQFAALPQEMLAHAREWLTRFAASVRAAGAPAPVLQSEEALTLLQVPDPGPGEGATERAVHFSPKGLLFGIVTEPRPGEPRRRAVVLVNNGANYHIGAGRLHVSLARRWALHGYVVLRMDLAGLGDSGVRPGSRDNEVFPREAVEDMRAALAFLRERYQVGELTVAGVCSGAYHALRAAAAHLPVSRIFMVNPESFSWRDGEPIDAVNLAEVVRTRAVHAQRALSLERFKLTSGSRLRAALRLLRIRMPHDVAGQFEAIAARGVQTTIVFSEGEPGIELLQIQVGSALARLGDRCRVHVIAGADHTFSRSAARAELGRILSQELFAPTNP